MTLTLCLVSTQPLLQAHLYTPNAIHSLVQAPTTFSLPQTLLATHSPSHTRNYHFSITPLSFTHATKFTQISLIYNSHLQPPIPHSPRLPHPPFKNIKFLSLLSRLPLTLAPLAPATPVIPIVLIFHLKPPFLFHFDYAPSASTFVCAFASSTPER
jgi:hypothetical protein